MNRDLAVRLPQTVTDPTNLARALGWFSLGLGLAELLAGGSLNRSLGVSGRAGLTRSFGLREITAGIGLLGGARLGPWMWARVAGDVLDLAALGWAMAPPNRERGRVGAASALVAGITALDILCAVSLTRREA